jgi:hypothetical protein
MNCLGMCRQTHCAVLIGAGVQFMLWHCATCARYVVLRSPTKLTLNLEWRMRPVHNSALFLSLILAEDRKVDICIPKNCICFSRSLFAMLHSLFSSLISSRYRCATSVSLNVWNQMGGACSTSRRDEKCRQQNMVGKPKEKRPRGRTRCRRENDSSLDLTETGSEVVDCIHLAQDSDEWGLLWPP